ncbi:MAG: sulfatase-like hydrolase/transferase, partial [Actinomycetia bacterium]|nr:sulfatase-like hydrolase/transferase [Actinomycetes bacterium]
LVVWMSDNGPMYAAGIESSGCHWLKGGKGQVTEGGMRTPAIAWWPGTIEARQDPMDIISVTDFFTTAARLGGASEKIPNDRVTDGVDQTSFLVLGEGHSHRDYMFYYSGSELGAVRKRQYKHTMGKGHGGIPGGAFFDVISNPKEDQIGEGVIPLRFMSLAVPFQDLVKEHKKMIAKFPHRVLAESDAGHTDQETLEA